MREFIKNWVLPPGVSRTMGLLLLSLRGKPPEERARLEENRVILAKNEALRDRHKGQRCFILGAGSSIKKQDLKKLKGETVISVSNTFVHPDYPLFRPRYHVLPSIFGHTMHSTDKFVKWLKEMEQKTFDAEMFFHYGDKGPIETHGLFRNRTVHWIEYCAWDGSPNTPLDLSNVPTIWSVSELAITAALFMGFEKIYLLGMDHDWFNGPLVYFYDEKKEHAMKPDKESLAFADSEFQMRRHADIFKKYKYLYGLKKNIYNANADPNTYLDVFPRVSYDSLFPAKRRRESTGEV
ncbi:MAG: hypothetical protein HY954_06015 [Deltaproteobacteria bacterium]|nr:hypothetical protein [Deltaproteobacteria bacterium]